MDDILLLMVGIIGIIACVAILVAMAFYDKWQKAKTFNANLIINMINQREYLIDKGCEFLKQQGKDWWEGYGIPFSIEDYRKAMMEEQK